MERSAAVRGPVLRDGVYRSTLNVDGVIAAGQMSLVEGRGTGRDGRFQFEVHVSGTGAELGGIVNVLMDDVAATAKRLPEHFSLRVSGSGDPETFNLIGRGPNGIFVEIDARWLGE